MGCSPGGHKESDTTEVTTRARMQVQTGPGLARDHAASWRQRKVSISSKARRWLCSSNPSFIQYPDAYSVLGAVLGSEMRGGVLPAYEGHRSRVAS